MSAMASQITSLMIVYTTVYSGADQGKHQSSASLVLVRGSHRWPAISSHKGPVTRKMFPFDVIIMWWSTSALAHVRDMHLKGKHGVHVLTCYPRRTNSTSTRQILVYFLNKDKRGVWQHTEIPFRSTLWWIITMMKNQHWIRIKKLIELYYLPLVFRDPCGIWRGTSHKCGCQLCHKPITFPTAWKR